MKIDTQTQLCAVIGNPVAHSLSPAIHNAAFGAAGLNYAYVAFCVEDLPACLAGMRALPSFRGLSVTIPHKIAIIDLLDEVEPMARRIGSVNTVTNEAGHLIGSSTDGPGTLRAFQEEGIALRGKRVLFLGSGGAVRAVAFAMAESSEAESITILGRTPARVERLVGDLRESTRAAIESGDIAADLETAVAAHDVLVQGTPVGMFGHDEARSCVPAEFLRPGLAVFDMVYRPLRTQLIRDAEAVGCPTLLGLEMLVNQAALQFETWTGAEAPRGIMRETLLGELSAKERAHN